MNERGAIGLFLLVIVVVLVVGGGAAWYFMQNRGGLSVQETPSPSPTLSVASPAASPLAQVQGTTLTGKITDLVKQGQNLTCTFQRPDPTGSVAGTVYVAAEGQKLKGDFTVAQPGAAATAGHMLRDGQTMYVWLDGLAQGTKFTIEEEASPAPAPESSAQQDVIDQNFTYTCQDWVPDQATFTLPTDKQFVDISAQLQQMQSGTAQPNAQQCATCNQLQEPAKAQCLQALGC